MKQQKCAALESFIILPFVYQQTVNHHISEAILQPFRLSQNAFLLKTQLLRNCTTFLIFRGAAYHNSIQTEFIERIVNQYSTSFYDKSFTFKSTAYPVA